MIRRWLARWLEPEISRLMTRKVQERVVHLHMREGQFISARDLGEKVN